MHVAKLPTCGPLLILSPALKRWGPRSCVATKPTCGPLSSVLVCNPPPPLPPLRAHLVAKSQQLLVIHMVAPKAPEKMLSLPLPILSTLHPNTILEPNFDSNAHPNPQPAPNPTLKPYP